MSAKLKLERGMDPDLADELMEEFADMKSGDKLVFKVPEDGEQHAIRVLPGNYGRTGKVFFRKQIQHWAPDPRGKSKFNLSFTCPLHQDKGDKPCAFCAARDAWIAKDEDYQARMASASSDDELQKLERAIKVVSQVISALNYRQSYIINVVPMDEQPLTTKVFYSPKTAFEPIFRAYTKKTGVINVEDGHDFQITRKKERNQVKYTVDPELNPTVLSEDPDEIERLLKGRRDLNKEIVISPPADLTNACKLLIVQIVEAAKKEAAKGGGSSSRSRPKPKPKQVDDAPAPSAATIGDIDDDDDIPMGDAPDVNLDEQDGDEAGGDDMPAARVEQPDRDEAVLAKEPAPAKKPAPADYTPPPTTAHGVEDDLAELAEMEADLESI
jgi:hypothetical protein